MAIFQNLVARLSLDSTAFDRNARRSSQTMKSMQRESLALQKRVLGLAGAYIGTRGLTGAMRSVISAYMEQEAAENRLRAALQSTGDFIASNYEGLRRYAAQIQRATIYGDEEILNQMAYARSLGITSDRLREVTKGAIGLATSLGMDLKTSVRYAALALQGEFTMLRRYIPELRATTDAGEQLAIIQEKMAQGFRQAQAEAETTAGRMKQLRNQWGDLKEQLGATLESPMSHFMEDLSGTVGLIQDLQKAWNQWRADVEAQERKARQERAARVRGETPSDLFAVPGATGQAFRRGNGSMFNLGPTQFMPNYTKLPQIVAGTDEWKQFADEWLSEPLQPGREPKRPKIQPIAPGETAAGGTTASGTAGIVKETEKITSDIAASYRRMYNDLNKNTQESWTLRKVLLIQELKENLKTAEDQATVWRWYEEQRQELARERAIAIGSLEEGFTARLGQMTDELQTIGQLGADLADGLRDGLVGSLTDAVFEARNLGDALEETARSMAKMVFQWGMNQLVTGGLNSAFNVGVAHGGATVGGGMQVKRPSVPWPFAGAQRFHNGGEVPAWLEPGERVQSRQQVAAGDRSQARIVQLLERLVAAERGTTVINSFDPADIVEKAAQTRRGQRAILNLIGRNQ